MDKLKINYENIPVMSIGFTRSQTIIGKLIRFFRSGSFINHCFFVTCDNGWLFATEQTPRGLQEISLETYTTKKDYIVKMYDWLKPNDIDEKWKEEAQKYLSGIRCKMKENSQYDFIGLLKFIPFIKNFIKPDPQKQWCSENVASILKLYGANFIDKVEIAPDQLLNIIEKNEQFKPVLNFYKEVEL